MSNAEDFKRIAAELKHAALDGDLDALRRIYAPDATIWHNVEDNAMTVEESLEFIGGAQAVIARLSYEEPRIKLTDEGFVLQHKVSVLLENGDQVRIPSCLVVTVRDGHISLLEEYFDAAAAAPIFAAIAALAQAASE